MFRINYNPENEIQVGEYYIDIVGVSPAQQGEGIGSGYSNF
ncbi:MAG: hypothetical protein QHC79_17330 [Pseudosphingobacterium sp.]|uniref:N-acetyltransferase domain-containing protein n=1 Tax=Olivibacter jilunii TaxID=985016 RepID=A0ABW6B0H7_9SPHI|nr:hypothetical protein [Pseudosphingobacterium sp.]